MGFIDKLKNVFFEEVEEEEEEAIEEKPLKLAKKIDVPKRKERVIEKNETVDEDFFREEKMIEPSKVEDFVVQEETYENSNIQDDNYNKMPMMFEEEDFFDDTYQMEEKQEYKIPTRESRMEKKELYQGKKEPTYIESVSKNYQNTSSAKSYYENKENKGFKPSPIISPIYGVLDKNYRKEEVVTKKDNKSSVNNNRKVDLDSVRNKAFGNEGVKENKKADKVEVKKEIKVEVKKEEKTLYDVNKSKPDINRITLADADEYYNDLGLAYNVDYNDTSRDTRVSRSKKYHDDEKENHDDSDGNDNLFDLIDLMYNKED